MTTMRGASGASVDLDDARLDELRTTIRGRVITQDDPGFDEARAVHNAIYDRRPGLIIECSGTADVVDALALARSSTFWWLCEAVATASRATARATAGCSSTSHRCAASRSTRTPE